MRSTNLDLLRATAVCIVVVTHLFEAAGNFSDTVVKLGRSGVLMFFVHTSFVLMQSLERLEAEEPRRLALRFYIRRVFRIYPLSILMIVLVVTVCKIYPITVNSFFARYQPTLGQLIANLSLTQNLVGVQDIIVPMWSLPPEVQMYAALPVFYFFRKTSPTSMLLFWAGWVIMLAFIDNTAPFELLQYLPAFLPGIIAYQYTKRIAPTMPGWLWPIVLLLPIGIYVVFSPRMTNVTWVVCLILGLSIPHFKPLQSKSISTLAAIVARYSYGIYLAHLACIFVAFGLLWRHPLPARIAAFGLLLIASSAVLYHSIEHPFIKVGANLARKMTTTSSKATAVAAAQ